ncbi:MAG: hypothetical protein ACLPN6_09705 [Streptosporangiaceae bacterium]
MPATEARHSGRGHGAEIDHISARRDGSGSGRQVRGGRDEQRPAGPLSREVGPYHVTGHGTILTVPVVLLLAALVILAGVVVVAMGRGGELAQFPPDTAPGQYDFRSAAEVARLHLPPALLGYNVRATDDALLGIAHAIADRDAHIEALREQIAAMRAEAEQQAHGAAAEQESALAQPGARDAGGAEASGAEASGAEASGAEASGAEASDAEMGHAGPGDADGRPADARAADAQAADAEAAGGHADARAAEARAADAEAAGGHADARAAEARAAGAREDDAHAAGAGPNGSASTGAASTGAGGGGAVAGVADGRGASR